MTRNTDVTSEPLVVFDRVGKRFGEFVAVEPMNLEINKASFAIMGSSGGKTTTLRNARRPRAPTEGEICPCWQTDQRLPTRSRDTRWFGRACALPVPDRPGERRVQ